MRAASLSRWSAPSGAYFNGTGSSGRIIVNKNSAVQRPRDLNGLVVSVASLNDIQTIAARSWIDKDGGNSAAGKFLEATGQEAAIALDTGHVDAASLVAPLLTQLVDTGKYRVLGDPTAGIASRLLEAAWFSTTAYTAKNPSVVRRFSQIIGRASSFCNDHPDQTVALLVVFSAHRREHDRARAAGQVRPDADPRRRPAADRRGGALNGVIPRRSTRASSSTPTPSRETRRAREGPAEAFSDGVIAVIITIMVLELHVPHGSESPPRSAGPGPRSWPT